MRGLVLPAVLCALALAAPSAALAVQAPPTVAEGSFSGVTATSATLAARIDPHERPTAYHFEYLTQAEYLAEGESFGAEPVSTPTGTVPTTVKGSGDLLAGSKTVTGVQVTEGAFGPGEAISGPGIPPGTTIGSASAEELVLSAPATQTVPGAVLSATGPEPVSAPISGLAPGTAYRFRVVAENAKGKNVGAETAFSTYPAPPVFGPCPNDAFRTGPYAPAGDPSAFLPDCRAYEQASPIDKDGGDVVTGVYSAKASPAGDAVTFGSTYGLPGGVGSQGLPTFRAVRTGAGWTSTGVLPAGSEAQIANVKGWLPDLSLFFDFARRLGSPPTETMLATTGQGAPRPVTPFAPGAPGLPTHYVGASADGSTALFEGAGKVSAWDSATGKMNEASVLNSTSATQAALPHGAVAGPYDWIRENAANGGGSAADYYLQDERAVSEDGSVFFTAAGSGRIFQRLHPTAPQSPVVHEGEAGEECTVAEDACTLAVSASHRTPPDPAGRAPAAFQVASADGTAAFFTSSEKLTAESNTGPEVQAPVIGRARLEGEGPAGEREPEFLKSAHAVGIAVAGGHVYWADPTDGEIGRARLDASGDPVPDSEEPGFITPGPTCFETHPQTEPGVSHCAPSTPRYVAVGPCAGGGECVYWTNTGPLGGDYLGNAYQQLNEPVEGAGTIGRAELDGSSELVPESVDPKFIKGASNPQGIAVNASHVYWANSLYSESVGEDLGISRSDLGGDAIDRRYIKLDGGNQGPFGVAIDANYVYYAQRGPEGLGGFIGRAPLEGVGDGPDGEFIHRGIEYMAFTNGPDPRGIAVDGTYAYWVMQGRESIGRVRLADLHEGSGPLCGETPGCEQEFIKPAGSLNGLATDPGAEHLLWSANGEVPANPGNDLYRFRAQGTGGCAEPGGCLTDLTVDHSVPDGADVVGVLGASTDGSRLYFVANAVLAGNIVDNGAGPEQAEPGDCSRQINNNPHGECDLYLWEAEGAGAGQITFLTRLAASDGIHAPADGDAADWTPRRFGSGFVERQSRVSPSGGVLLLRSRRRLTAYESHGSAEFYLYRAGQGIVCVSCDPTGAPPSFVRPNFRPTLGSTPAPQLENVPAMTSSRNLAGDGGRVFFETTEALVPADTDGVGGCPQSESGTNNSAPICQDVYEWEEPGTGTCTEGGAAFSPANGGCIYLLSSGTEKQPSFFADASESGDDAFIYTRAPLVGQDTDSLVDVYDAKVGGGLAFQNPPPGSPPCEADACKGPASSPSALPGPATPGFQGEGNRKARGCVKGKVLRGRRCVTRHQKHRKKKHPAKHRKHAHRAQAHKRSSGR